MATQHRSRRARAIQKQRIDAAEAAEDLRHAGTEEGPLGFVAEDETFARQLVPAALRLEGWSVLEAADEIAALAMSAEPALASVTLGEQLRERDRALLRLIGGGHSEALSKARGRHGETAVAAKPLLARKLASSAVSVAD